MLRKMTVAFLLVAALYTSALPLGSQTRPRRVNPVPTERTEERAPRRRGMSLMRVLIEGGIGLGSQIRHRGRDSCTPSRDIIRDQPGQRF